MKKIFAFLRDIFIKFGDLISLIKTKIIIGFLFFCVFYPIGIIGKIFGKQFLDKKIDKKKETYFEKVGDNGEHSFDEQF
ncbi:hypothetical protein LR002_00980 [Candidatus Gracilibacteria bacterium]|nr:hypothetical protein [Candidatus Gracilibacteria bacterium]